MNGEGLGLGNFVNSEFVNGNPANKYYNDDAAMDEDRLATII